ncbi:alkyl sulfatase BDS1-like metallo-beta-lactamase superfamily hydrolase [Rhodopseudomonas thermotolerans]|uniref:Linear primary-alkylsulfatase n=2 Tax=Rhodopseudomonas TaxID=1073 RepID=A0A336JXH9_9BRAD|nr:MULTISPECIES: alkyl sulfatase dimerization domain-containing protein [Rhodopseudomonas]RED29165.1 alkyl sulfatase BDS1-like metallo-beta-lactamase superfamily hydrolase [Rhodopseudomonas pentothenatexigens]REF92350.1 alkyl sulfatase BDS1-like metallo-beta-lactamase superfamily hydrolase [Rhodopseudomonas thermotolerans]SSW92364.1 alkyl sulfatase BDS1-like metallo-beta-lactamase superfamily hydrolase [Rhodopseudomonas pentothenatexigens]
MHRPTALALLVAALALPAAAIAQPNDAEPATRAANEAVAKALPLADRADFEDAQRGLIAPLPNGVVAGAAGAPPVWNLKPFDFLKGGASPPTVNPSLWRQAQLNLANGLFQVADRVYQVRGLDMANLTIVEGDTGLIVTDTTMTVPTAKAALDLYYQHRPNKPVVALIYTHSHIDHFGGARGLISEADAASGKVKVIAPAGFMEHAVAENVIAGNAMSRRAQFQFGAPLPVGERGQVDAGLGKALALGPLSLIPPNDTIQQSYETRTIDGVEIEFHLVPGSEAPSEMISYYPQFRLLNMAEDTTHTLHNLYTLRGAAVRDGRLWSKYIGEAIDRYGDRTDIVIAQHHWPVWGRDRVVGYLKKQRDVYKFIHDQSVRLLNHGLTPTEIAERLTLPPSLAGEFAARGYYGSVSHNAKAVYQFYLGWYDANPAELNPLPRAEQAKKEIDYMGGAAAVLARARDDYKAGQYRWVASVASKLVFADPANKEARALGADALEQLGYQAEAATWRNAYLLGAQELRSGLAATALSTANPDLLKAVSVDLAFDFLAVRLNPAKAEGKRIVVNWTFSDTKETYTMTLENSALSHVAGKLSSDANVSVTLSRPTFDAISLKQRSFLGAIATGDLWVSGNPLKLRELFGMFDEFSPNFEVIEPVKASVD